MSRGVTRCSSIKTFRASFSERLDWEIKRNVPASKYHNHYSLMEKVITDGGKNISLSGQVCMNEDI